MLMLSSSSVLRNDGPMCWSSRNSTSIDANAAFAQAVEAIGGDLLVALDQTSPVFGIDDVVRRDAADDLFERDRNFLDARRLHLLDGGLGDLAAFLDDQLVVVAADVARGLQAHQLVRLELLGDLATVEEDRCPSCSSS